MHQLVARNAFRGKRMKIPMLEERGKPLRVRKVIGELPKAIPFLAVDKINPGSDLTETQRLEDALRCFHCNGLNKLDSLQPFVYPAVMSITWLGHYSKGSLEQTCCAARSGDRVNRCL